MARPRQIEDEELLSVARRVFLAQGATVSTQVIADAVGLSQAALFKRFGTKQALLLRALQLPDEIPWFALAARPLDHRPAREQLTAILRGIEAFLTEVAPCLAVLKASHLDLAAIAESEGLAPPPIAGHRLLTGWLTRAMAAGAIRSVDARALATTLMGALQGRVMLAHLFNLEIADEGSDYVDAVMDVLWRGLAPGEGA